MDKYLVRKGYWGWNVFRSVQLEGLADHIWAILGVFGSHAESIRAIQAREDNINHREQCS